MPATSMSRMVLLASVAACGIPLVFAIQHFRREPPVDAKAPTAAPAVSKPASGALDQGPDALAAAQAKADAVTGTLAGSPVPPDSDDGVPTFDIARIEPTGEAVIAGRAAPGATVELLRNGELHDRAVADQAGEFVMVPPPLPPGTYDLTLRSRQPDGKQATSKQSVAVAIEPGPTDRPVVALMTPGKPTVVLSQPAPPKPMAGAVVVESVEIEPGGKFHATGRAGPGAAVRLYLNDTFVASATAGADGRFAVTINEGVAPGNYRVRLDEVEPNSGAVRARAEVPFNVPDTMVTGSRRRRPQPPSGRTLPLHSSRNWRPPRRPFCQTEARPPPWLCRRSRPPPSPAATASGASAAHLWRGHTLRRHLQGEPEADPQSQPDLSRPDLCPSSAVRGARKTVVR